MRVRRWLSHVSVFAALNLFGCAAWAVDASNVLVLFNAASSDSLQIANYYALVHPGVRLLGLNGVSTSDDISADDYLSTIRPQVLSALNSTTDVIVTTKGLPLRVNVSESAPTATWPNLPTYVDPSGTTRQILNWKPTSSLESELTNIGKVSTWQMMGDQSYLMPGQFTSNPYYHQTASFNSATTGTYLSSRLDGFTVSDVTSSIDRAQHAFVGPRNAPNSPTRFLVDNDPSKSYAPTMANLVNNVLTPAGLPVSYDNTSAFVGSTTGRVIGYDSHGANQASTPSNYISSGLNITLVNGAVFNSWESYNAASFTAGGNHGNQGLIGDWLAKGGTAGAGNVAEPGANISSVANEDQLFSMLLQGKTWAEAAWSSLRQLSYVNTVVGDPLMTWHPLLAGDVNMDGCVDISDLNILAANWGKSLTSGGSWSVGDLNGDGFVDMSDLVIVSADWGQVSSGAFGLANTAGLNVSDLSTYVASSIPEPSSFVLTVIGIGSLVGCRWRKRRRSPKTPSNRA